jgi:hypothetical protein
MMKINWYYVDREKHDRVGPVAEGDLLNLIKTSTLDLESYVWRKGFENWMQLKDVSELLDKMNPVQEATPDIPSLQSEDKTNQVELEKVSWEQIDRNERLFHIKTGRDRNQSNEAEYGPFTLNELIRLFHEKRISGETLFFYRGFSSWYFLVELPNYRNLFGEEPIKLDDLEKRTYLRRPFVARMFFHDNQHLYEGICRDISIGGMQVLVSDFPGKVGDIISMNVHPDNSEYCFVATGEIVRFLEGRHGFSFRFTDLSEEAHNSIEQYLKREI